MPRPLPATGPTVERESEDRLDGHVKPEHEELEVDIARSFERHVKGLTSAFHRLQHYYHEHHIELLRTNGHDPMSVSLQPLRREHTHTAFHNLEPEKQHLMSKTLTSSAVQDVLRHSCLAGDREPVGHVPSTLTVLPAEPKQKQTEQLEEYPDLMSEPMSDEGLLMQRQYKAQFQRLDKASNGRLEEEDLLAVMQSFYPGWELEDLPTVIHEVGRLHHHRLAVHHGRSSPGAVAGVKSYHESMDFDGFVALLSDDELIDGAETKGSVKRDVKILREALQAENNYNLYKDDGDRKSVV